MKGFTHGFLITALLAGPYLLSEGAQANAFPTEHTPAATRRLSIQYDKGLLAARILNTPLGEVGRKLAQKAGVRFVLSDPSLATLPVSATLKGLPLREGISKILAGFSHALYPFAETGKLEVNVLAAAEGPAAKNSAARNEPTSPTGTHVPDYAPPELRTLEMEVDPEAQSAREWEAQAREHEHQEALLQHVLDAQISGSPHVPTETLALLPGLDDPRATQVLIAAVLSADEDNKARAQAVEILWRHAVDLEFRGETTVDALRQLADDSDRQTAQIARQALQSMEQ